MGTVSCLGLDFSFKHVLFSCERDVTLSSVLVSFLFATESFVVSKKQNIEAPKERSVSIKILERAARCEVQVQGKLLDRGARCIEENKNGAP